MSAIDEFLREMVYAADGAARQSFTLDRENAIALLREFALADPHYYILELVQAAVANGASAIEIVLYRYGAQVDLRVHWQGVCFSRLELTNLLDYLFEDQEDLDQADRILLSRGINGLLRFEPRVLRVFSEGYGEEGPTEVDVDGRTATATLTEPDEARLRRGGVTIHADDLRAMPEHLRFARGRNILWPEELALRERLVGEVEVLYNERPVARRGQEERPAQGVEVIRELDLRGELWWSRRPSFQVATYGVAIETMSGHNGPFAGFSGYVESARFVKTADQYRVVREGNFDHVVARMLPYLRRGRERRDGGQQEGEARGPSHGFEWVDGRGVAPDELVATMKETSLLLAIAPEERGEPGLGWARFAEEVGGRVLVVPDKEVENLRALAGHNLEVARWSWRSARVQAFARQRILEPPERPWLIEEITTAPRTITEVLEDLAERYDLQRRERSEFRKALGPYGSVVARVFTPDREDGGEVHRDWVRLRTCGRLAWSGAVGSLHPGHVLQVELPAVSPEFLASPAGQTGEVWARLLAEYAVDLARAELEMATEMAVSRVEKAGAEAGSVASRIALRSLSSDVILRLRRDEHGALEFVPVAMSSPERLLRAPVVRSLTGEAFSLQEICARLGAWGGVVPFVHEATQGDEVEERPTTLVLDEEQEELLGEILGLAFLEPRDEPEEAQARSRQRLVIQTMAGASSPEAVMEAARAGRPVVMLDGRPGVSGPGLAASPGALDEPLELLMNPWLAVRMERAGVPVKGGFEFPFPTEMPEAYLVQREVATPLVRGTVGLLRPGLSAGKVAVLASDEGTSMALALAAGSGLAGVVEVSRRGGEWKENVVSQLHAIEGELWEELLGQLRTNELALEALLELAGRHLHLYVDEAGVRHFDVSHPVAATVFDEPLALCGPFPVTLERLTRDYCLGEARQQKSWLELQVELPEAVRRWQERYLTPEREQRAGRRTTVRGELTGISRCFQDLWPGGEESVALRFPFGSVSFEDGLPDVAMVALTDSEGTSFGLLEVGAEVGVRLDPGHPLVASAQDDQGMTPALAALLYGIYDGLRAFYDLPWSHELAFQEALVLEMLE